MKVSQALKTRISCRAFLNTPVPAGIVRDILHAARQTPSGGNLQPWHVYAITGEPLADLLAKVRARHADLPAGDGMEYTIYPDNLKEPYRARRYQCAADLYAAVGVARQDKAGRWAQFIRNFEFFDAPVGLFFTVDRQMGPPQWSDIGMFLMAIMLLAREHGLHTCPQEAWAHWHTTVAQHVGIGDEEMLFCGMGLGYMDETAPVNALRTERASLDEIAVFQGFAQA